MRLMAGAALPQKLIVDVQATLCICTGCIQVTMPLA